MMVDAFESDRAARETASPGRTPSARPAEKASEGDAATSEGAAHPQRIPLEAKKAKEVINSAHKKINKNGKKHKKNKTAMGIRFDADLIPQIDDRAEALGLSRAAWVRMIISQALAID